jgi:glucosamine-6-phosphate deaminase
MNPPLDVFPVEQAVVQVYPTKSDMSYAAAVQAGRILQRAISRRGRARVIIATGNSQIDFMRTLTRLPDLKWGCVEAFHMDEYVGMPESHPASFRRWVKTRWADVVHPGPVHYLQGDAADLDEECRRYGELVGAAPMDACFLGFGENGHVAFNDPHVADFEDRQRVKRVDLDKRCRHQQLGEGHFPTLETVPREALTLTCPTLMSAEHLICCVPEARKAEVTRNALENPVSTDCPASRVRSHSSANIFLDLDSAALLSEFKESEHERAQGSVRESSS